MTGQSRWTAGLRCGPAHDRDQYTLVRRQHTGYEGELWLATRFSRDGEAERCAVKILMLPAQDDTPDGREHWRRRWEDGIHRASRVRSGGLVVPSACFVGALPHPAGTAGEGDVPYLVSPWIDAETLEQWALRLENGLEQRMAVLARLCQAVDELHRNGLVHRDVSGANVLVNVEAHPYLIDFTFLAPLGREVTVAVRTPGFAIRDEEKSGEPPNEAKDRFAVGSLARLLLLPHAPELPDFDAAVTTRRQLIEHGYDTPVADWLIQALDADPRRRPRPLVQWAQRLAELVAESERRPDYSCVALCGGGRLGPVVVSGGRHGVAYHVPVEEGETSDVLPPDRGAPRAIQKVAATRNGNGQLVVAATDSGGTLWLGSPGQWTMLAHESAGLALLAAPRGEALVWTVHRSALAMFRAAPGAAPSRRAAPGRCEGRVVAATWHGTQPVVLVAEADRLVAYRWLLQQQDVQPMSEVVVAMPVAAAALAVDRLGELEAVVLCWDSTMRTLRRHFSGEWLEQRPQPGTYVGTPGMASIRGGAAIALAGGHGVRVLITPERSAAAEWTVIADQPADTVALCQGDDWRLRIATIAGGEIRCWAESWGGSWNPYALETRRPAAVSHNHRSGVSATG